MNTEKEIQALLSLLWMLASDPRMLVLFALLVVASISDCRSYRIPNWLTFGGALFALLSGMVMARTPGVGAVQALSGLALGFVLLLPGYALGLMGAGDVKLMAMVGAFLGAGATFQAVLLSFIASGVFALAFAIYHRKLLRITAREAATLTDDVTLVAGPEASERLTRQRWPKVIISASGMATGGRVLHHLKALAPNPRNHIVFPGFQVGGTPQRDGLFAIYAVAPVPEPSSLALLGLSAGMLVRRRRA